MVRKYRAAFIVSILGNGVSRNICIKVPFSTLRLSTAQIRRVNVADCWDPTTKKLSYAKLISIATSYATLANKGGSVYNESPPSALGEANTTYIDEDGDKITMSSDDELVDAFRQTFKKIQFRPFRITVAFPKNEDTKVCAAVKETASIPPKKIQPRRTGVIPKETIKATPKPKIAVEGKDATPNMGCHPVPKSWMSTQKFEDNFFIHARHTCDGCSKTPIIGTRYHATKIPDFDLCGVCYKQYNGEDLDFKPEVLGKYEEMFVCC